MSIQNPQVPWDLCKSHQKQIWNIISIKVIIKLNGSNNYATNLSRKDSSYTISVESQQNSFSPVKILIRFGKPPPIAETVEVVALPSITATVKPWKQVVNLIIIKRRNLKSKRRKSEKEWAIGYPFDLNCLKKSTFYILFVFLLDHLQGVQYVACPVSRNIKRMAKSRFTIQEHTSYGSSLLHGYISLAWLLLLYKILTSHFIFIEIELMPVNVYPNTNT